MLEATLNCLAVASLSGLHQRPFKLVKKKRNNHANNKAGTLRGVMGAWRGVAWGNVECGGGGGTGQRERRLNFDLL